MEYIRSLLKNRRLVIILLTGSLFLSLIVFTDYFLLPQRHSYFSRYLYLQGDALPNQSTARPTHVVFSTWPAVRQLNENITSFPAEPPHLTIHCIESRLGNQMSLLATLIGVANLNGRRAAIKTCHLEKLLLHFDLSSIPVVCIPNEMLLGYGLETYLHPEKDTHIPKNATILVGEGYPFSYTFFQHSVPEIRRLLTFRPKYTDYAQNLLRQVALQYKERLDNCIFVGLHVRITDYPQALTYRQGRAIDAEYFRKGMDHFRGKFANDTGRLIFVVASDDRDWCKRNFQGFNDVFISPSVNDPGFDMSLLVACNHSLISYGTFSFWSALLKNSGETVRFDDFYMPGSKFLKMFPYEKEYPPEWIPISTTPRDYWKNYVRKPIKKRSRKKSKH